MSGKKENDPEKIRRRWVIFITIFAFFLSVFMSTFSDLLLKKANTAVAFVILIASRVSNVCNDVIGDICGIISGSSAAFIVSQVEFPPGSLVDITVFSVVLSGIVASLTIGGKAFGKEIAINNSKEIVIMMGKILSVFKK